MSFPERVTIELTNDCNRECPECPRQKIQMKTGYMKCGLFRKIVRQLPDSTIIVPFFRGESTMHPNFGALMKELHRFEQVQLASNGDFLHRKRVRNGILDNCTFFSLSLHEHVLPQDNRRFTDFLWECNEKGLTTQVSIVDCNLKPEDKRLFVDCWLEHADRIRIYSRHSINSFGDIENPIADEGAPCRKPFKETAVYFDGRVALCNHDWNQPFQLGNLNNNTLMSVFNCGAYKFIRHWHSNKQRTSVPSCKDCTSWAEQYLPSGMLGELYTKPIGEKQE